MKIALCKQKGGNKVKLYYIFDSYCGWCYGFESILKPFVEAHPELKVTALSGGLFMDGHPLSAFPYMSDTNKTIAEMFGVVFGQPYQNLLETGDMIPDSNDAAIGFGILRSFLPEREHVNLASKMHEAFYLDGNSLSNVETIKSIAKSYDLPVDKIEKEFIRISAEGKYHPDFYEAKRFGVTSFPTLFLEMNGKYYDLKGNAITPDDLERNLNLIKEKGGSIDDGHNTPSACNINGAGCL